MTEEPVKEVLRTPTSPKPGTAEKSPKREVVVTTVPVVSEIQLMAATGGTELSCYRCIIPFAVVILITGIVVTAVAYRNHREKRHKNQPPISSHSCGERDS